MDINLENKDKIIYPHSVTVSKEPVRTKEVYTEFKNSIFYIYLSICSLLPEEDYIVNLNMIDINKNTENSNRILKIKSLKDEDFNYFMASFLIIFEPFKKNILNFEKGKPYSIGEYLKTVDAWAFSSNDNQILFK